MLVLINTKLTLSHTQRYNISIYIFIIQKLLLVNKTCYIKCKKNAVYKNS